MHINRTAEGVRLTERRGLSLRRMVAVFLGISGGLLLFALLGLAVLAVRVNNSPLEVELLRDKIVESLQRQLPAAANVTINKAFLVRTSHGPAVRIDQLVLKDKQDRTLIAAPSADIDVNPLALLAGRLSVAGLEFSDLNVHLAVLPEGKVAISAGEGEAIMLTPPAAASNTPGVGDIIAALFATASADTPIFGDTRRIVLVNCHLDVDDRRLGVASSYSKVNLTLDRSEAGGVQVGLAATGNSGPFSLKLLTKIDTATSNRILDFNATDVPLGELGTNLGVGKLPFDASMPLTAKGSISTDSAGAVLGAKGRLALGAGLFRLDDPDAEPMLVDEITTDFSFDATKNRVDITALELFSGLTHVNLAGQLDLPASPDGDYTLALSGKNAIVASEKVSGKSITIDSVNFEAAYSPAGQLAHLNRLVLKGPDIDAAFTLAAKSTPAGPAVSGSIAANKSKLRTMLHLWPSFIAPEVRTWLLNNVKAGMAEKANLSFDLDAAAFADALHKMPIPDASLTVDLQVSGGALQALNGVPPIVGIEGNGHFTGTTATFTAARGILDLTPRKLNFTDIKVSMPDHRPKLFPVTITGHVQGAMDAAVELLSLEALRKFNNVPGEPAQYKGQLDGTAEITFKVGKAATQDDIAVKTNLIASNVSVEKVMGAERLESANLTIITTKTTLSVKGDGRMFGTPVTLELKKNGAAPTDASMNFIMDEAARTRRGIDFGTGLNGPLGIKVTTQLSDGDHSKSDLPKGESRANVEIDLARATIDGLLPGWLKPANKPGKASFVASVKPDSIQLDQFALDAGNASFRGAVTLESDGSFDRAKLTSFRLSTQDELKVDIEKDGALYKVTGRADTIDARPYITDLLAHSRAKAANGQDFDLEMKAGALVGFNKERVEALSFSVRRRAGVVQKVQLTARLGGAPLKIISKENDPAAGYVVSSENAGALLAFLDMYRHMEGGSMSLNIRPQPDRMAGAITIHDFYLNDEQALKSLVSSNDSNGQGGAAHVKFTRLQGGFERTDGRIDITDAAMWGQQVGATLVGMIDYGRDRVDLAGNLIPAYEINNLFSKIPLFGPILGGGKNEGLFAINYRITGKASAPVLRVDPLSAVAPGIFRKILGVADGTSNNPDNFVVDVPPAQPALKPLPSKKPLQLGVPNN